MCSKEGNQGRELRQQRGCEQGGSLDRGRKELGRE
jgi:hypothetical protein